MKGVLFTELIEMIEELMGLEFTNKVIDDARLENQGAYTAIGTYPHQDMIKLLNSLSNHARNSPEKILKSYGECLFYRLSNSFTKELAEHPSAFSFLLQLEVIIKIDVLKLNPEAEMPFLKAALLSPNAMEIYYASPRKLGDLIEGLIVGCTGYFNEKIGIEREELLPDGSCIRFVLQKRAANE